VAGAGGAQLIADQLLEASDSDVVRASRVEEKLLGKTTTADKIDQKLGVEPAGDAATAGEG
jgi:hypothetical protein